MDKLFSDITGALWDKLGVGLDPDRLRRTIGPLISEYVGKHGLDEVKTALREWDEYERSKGLCGHVSIQLYEDGSGALLRGEGVECHIASNSDIPALIRQRIPKTPAPSSCVIDGKKYIVTYTEDGEWPTKPTTEPTCH